MQVGALCHGPVERRAHKRPPYVQHTICELQLWQARWLASLLLRAHSVLLSGETGPT